MAAGGAPPPGRLLSSVAYSPSRNRMVVALGLNNRTSPAHLDDLWVLTGARGSLPLVSENQAETTWPASTPSASSIYYWRVMARDSHGATQGSPVWRFRPNHAPLVSAGADQTITLPAVTATLAGAQPSV